MEFMREFPDDDSCLTWLWRNRFSADGKHADCPKCEREGVEFKQYATKQRRQTWTCTQCGHHVQPTAGTIFHGSSTSLHLWFYALHLMTSTRCGISAKQLERELGVTYKTAWRMFNLIRNDLMAEDDEPLSGEVEVDETSVEGKPRQRFATRSESARYRERSRATVVAAVERGGRIKATVLPSRRGPLLKQTVVEWVNPDSVVYTDEWPAYRGLDEHFTAHSLVNHSISYVTPQGWHTNTVEGFFGNLKTGIRGNYKKVSRRWLQGYLNEFTWRYNHRATVDRRSMFEALLLRTVRS
ncbi:MAG: IS1595 family transposase [Actinomycetota bacterium]|nr:IS1595 family transposase [Actinomycetota bacterium]